MLEIRDLRHRYDAAGAEVLRGVELTLGPGEAMAVVGREGAGKTTLLEIAGGMRRPDSGLVKLGGVEPYGLDERARDGFRNRNVGYCGRRAGLLGHLTLLENALLPLIVGEEDTLAPQRVRKLMGEVGLGEALHKFPAEVGAEARERAGLVRAFGRGPRMVLCDDGSEELAELALRLAGPLHAMVVMATSDGEAARGFGRRMELSGGVLSRMA